MRWLVLPLALAACDRAPKEPTRLALNDAVPTLAEPPPRAADQDRPGRDGVVTERMEIPEIIGIPIAAGRWSSTKDEARFEGRAPLFAITCERSSRTIVLRRFGTTGGDLQILANRGANLFAAESKDGDTVARFSATFPWFEDVLAKADGAFGVRVGGSAPLVLPADPSIAALIKVCR